MAKKIDLSGAKDFLFNHGEKVALGTCVLIALLFGTMGLLRALSIGKSPESGRPWTVELGERHGTILTGMNSATVPKLPKETEEMLKKEFYNWNPVSSNHVAQAYINVGEVEDKKRRNPTALAAKTGVNSKTGLAYSHLDYVPGLFFMHDLAPGQQGVKGLALPDVAPVVPQPKKKGNQPGGNVAQPDFVHAGDARRVIIGHLVFPMKDQVLNFQSALKILSQKEMFDIRDDLPKPLGFNLVRYEILPNGQPAKKDGELLVGIDPATGKPMIADRLKKFLSLAIYDEKNPALLKPYLFAGLTMPLPKLAYGKYPPVKLEGITSDEEDEEEVKQPGMMMKPPGGMQPRMKGGPRQPQMGNDPKNEGAAREYKNITRKQLRENNFTALDSRLFENEFNVYHVLGTIPSKDEVKPAQPFGPRQGPGMGGPAAEEYFTAWDVKVGDGDPANQPNVGVKPKAGPGIDPQAVVFPNWDRDALIRFIDVDVEPGKSYRYGIQIRLANPNFGKPNTVVAFAGLAAVEELVSEPVYTDAITIPHEYFLYAVDQQHLDEAAADKKSGPADPKMKDATTFQIQQWTRSSMNQEAGETYVIGDWAIAERVVVRKGDHIGIHANVLVPVWDKKKDKFEVIWKQDKIRGGKIGIHLNLMPTLADNLGGRPGDTLAPVLVDFTGGRRKVGTSNVEEETAIDALILTANGKLRVLNSRDASDAANLPAAKERQERLVRARQRVAEVLGVPAQKGPNLPGKGPALPGLGGN